MDSTTHSTVSDDQYQTTSQFSYLQQELAADSVGKGNNCTSSIVGKYSNVPQVAPRMTREGPYLYCHLSYTFFCLQCRVSLELIPWKGRSEGDASTKVIASSYCINTQNPGRNKLTHIYLLYLQKRNQQRTSDKVENEIENEVKSEPRTRTSTY